MTRRVRRALLGSAALAATALLLAPAMSSAKPREKKANVPWTAEETVESFTVAPGLETTVWATEPGMVNPTNMDIDSRGRIWVTEAANYRGSKTRAEGDRIMILEDTRHAGVADSYKVFVQDPQLFAPLGICVMGNKVIVAQSPNILVYTIDDSGDKPIGPPQVFFTGFGGVNHDHGVHSGIFGPDGRFYFNCGNEGDHTSLLRYGDYVKGKDGAPIVDITGSEIGQDAKKWHGHDRKKGQGYREGLAMSCNLDGSDFEVLGYNFRNNYELTVDSFGTVWQSDNDDDGNQGVRINYVMEGGNYGYTGPNGSNWGRDAQEHKADFPNQTKPEQHWHLRWPGVVPNLLNTGGGAPCGICIYEGDLLPEPYRGALLHCDAGPNVVRAYVTRPGSESPGGFFKPVSAQEAEEFKKQSNPNAGAGFVSQAVELVTGSDKWFRPDDICVAPDGAVYIADWYDPGVGGHATGDTGAHEGPGGWKKLHGRIYRLAPTGYKPSAVPAVNLDTPAGQIAALNSPNLATRYLGYTKLLGGIDDQSTQSELKRQLDENKNERLRARALWLLSRSANGRQFVVSALKDKDANIRVTAFRAARKIKMDVNELASQVLEDPCPAMWREMALALQFDADNAKAIPLVVKLADKYDGKDRWYLEAVGIAANGREKEVLEAWEKDHQNKDPKNNEGITWRLKKDPVQLGGTVSVAPPPPDGSSVASQGGAGPFAGDNGVAARGADYGSDSWPAVVELNAAGTGVCGKPTQSTDEKAAAAGAAVEQVAETQSTTQEKPALTPAGVPEKKLKDKEGKPLPSLYALSKEAGDAKAGAAVFRNAKTVNCIKCHQVGDEGNMIGPPLTAIGSKLSRPQLYESILYPSAAIEMGYETWVVKTKGGEVYSGLKAEDTPDHVTIKDSDGKFHDVDKDQIARIVKQPISLMPENLNEAITRKDLLNLVEYLTTLKG